jgi:hypothetical protein
LLLLLLQRRRRLLPCREVGYNHYKGRMGWEMPQTAHMLAANRPEK